MDADLHLLERIRAGDERALEDLMLRHQEPLFHFVLRYLGREHAARDIVQETFVRVFFKAATFEPRSSVKTWIYAIALNLCRDAGRRGKRAPTFIPLGGGAQTAETRSFDVPDPQTTADAAAEKHETIEHLRTAITQLPEKLRAPLVYCALELHSQQEAAELFGTTAKSIEVRIYRAKKKLQDILTRMGALER